MTLRPGVPRERHGDLGARLGNVGEDFARRRLGDGEARGSDGKEDESGEEGFHDVSFRSWVCAVGRGHDGRLELNGW